MAKVKFEHGKWDTFFGYQCEQCYLIIPYRIPAIEHDDTVSENNDICPNAKSKYLEETE